MGPTGVEAMKGHFTCISEQLSTISQPLFKYFRFKVKTLENEIRGSNIKGKDTKVKYDSCPFCGCPYRPDNHRVRLLPKLKMTPKIRKLLVKHSVDPSSLSKYQSALVKRFMNSQTKMVITCFSCKKSVKQPGQTRQERAAQIQRQQEAEEARKATEKPVKSKKAKRNEKKKRKQKEKRLRMAIATDAVTGSRDRSLGLEDPLAGVILAPTSITSMCTNENLPGLPSSNQKPLDITTTNQNLSDITTANQKHLPQVKSSTANQNKEISSVTNELGSSSTNTNKTLSSVLNSPGKSSTIQSKAKSSSSWSLSEQMYPKQKESERKGSNFPVRQSSSGKKRKAKDLCQQLNKALKSEGKKSKGGSLEAFLSSL